MIKEDEVPVQQTRAAADPDPVSLTESGVGWPEEVGTDTTGSTAEMKGNCWNLHRKNVLFFILAANVTLMSLFFLAAASSSIFLCTSICPKWPTNLPSYLSCAADVLISSSALNVLQRVSLSCFLPVHSCHCQFHKNCISHTEKCLHIQTVTMFTVILIWHKHVEEPWHHYLCPFQFNFLLNLFLIVSQYMFKNKYFFKRFDFF